VKKQEAQGESENEKAAFHKKNGLKL